MSIRVNIDPDLANFYHCPAMVEVNGSTVSQCLDHLAKQYLSNRKGSSPTIAKFLDGTLVFLNRVNIYDPDKPVKDGDELDILIIPYGG